MKQARTQPIPRAERLPRTRQGWPPLAADAALLCLLLLLGALFLRAAPLGSVRAFSLGGTDTLTARSFHPAETTEAGRGFRWTNGDSALVLPPQGFGAHTLRFSLSAPWPAGQPVPLTLSVNDLPALAISQDATPRRYALLVPAQQIRWGDTIVRLQSPTFAPQEVNREPRLLGLAVFEADWRALAASPWLVPAQLVALALALTLFGALLYAGGVPFWLRAGTLLLLAAILLVMRHSDSRFVYRWHALVVTLGLAGALGVGVGVVWWWSGFRVQGSGFRVQGSGVDGEGLEAATVGAASLVVGRWSFLTAAPWRALAGYVVVTLAMLLPLVMRFTTHVIGAHGDNFEYLWKMQWFYDALVGQRVSPVFVPQIFYPTGTELTISEMAPAHTLLMLPFTALFGATVSYNLAIGLSFVLSGCFTYLLARRLGAQPGAAWVAGLIFAFSLRRFYHATGHFGMMGTQWLPLALYGWEGVLTRRRPIDGFVCGLGLALASWSTLHYGATFPLLLAAYAPLRLGLRALPGLLAAWRPLVLAGAIFVALVAPVAQPYLESQARGETFKHTYTQLILHSSTLGEYLLPNPYHPLWGRWASQFYRLTDGGEHNFGLGYSVVALTLAAFWFARPRRVVLALGVIIAINVVMTLGPELRLPSGAVVPLPVRFFYTSVPVLGNIRTWSRMAMYVVLCCALLAALALSAAPARWRRPAWVLASALVLLELWSLLPLSPTAPRAVDRWLRTQPGTGAVAQVPNGFGGESEYATLFTGKPSNQGTGKFPPPAYREGRNILVRFPDSTSLRLLQRWQTDYLVVDHAAMALERPDWRAAAEALPLIREVYRDEAYTVYRVSR